MTPLYLLAAIVAVGGWFLLNGPRGQSAFTDADATAEMRARSQQAVSTARDQYNISLDFSPQSVGDVESILSNIHDKHLHVPLTQKQLVREALTWGGYIGEAIIRIKPAHWEVDSDVNGPGSFPVVFNEIGRQSFPVRWCYNRLINGSEDNVWYKFDLLTIQDVDPRELGATAHSSGTDSEKQLKQ